MKMPPIKDTHDDARLFDVFRDLYMRGELLDVAIVCEGKRWGAHRVVLAAHSDIFRNELSSTPVGFGNCPEISFTGVANAEAVKVMLDYLYKVDIAIWEERNMRSLPGTAANVICLARHFHLPGLEGIACRWLMVGITTHNVLQRLEMCEELGLEDTRSKILKQLAKDKEALADVSNSKQLMQNPHLLHDLLKQASVPGPEPKWRITTKFSEAAAKKARKS